MQKRYTPTATFFNNRLWDTIFELLSQITDFSLSGGCFGTDIIQNVEMVSDRSSRAEILTDFRQMSMRVLFDSKK